MSERSFISLGDMSMIEGNKPIAKLKVSLANDNPLQGHMQFMTLMNKRLLTAEKLLEAWEVSGLAATLPLLQRAELAVQAGFFIKVFNPRPKPPFVNMGNAEALLEIVLKLCRAKNGYLSGIGAKVVGLIFQDVSQEISQTLTTKLQTPLEQKHEALAVFKLLEQSMHALRAHNRGFVELNDLEYFFERGEIKI